MDDSIIANPGEIVLVKVNNSTTHSFYIKIESVTADAKRGWWNVEFYPLIVTPNFKVIKANWILDDSQIRGEEFTMGEISHQLVPVETLNKDIPIQQKYTGKPTLTLIKGGKN